MPSQTALSGDTLEQLRGLRMTRPDRVLYPETGITKKELAAYYAQVGDWILPHVGERLLSLVRCPEGHEMECFFQKHARPGIGEDIRTMSVQESGKKASYVYVDDLRGLLSLVQISTLEIHAWGSRVDRLERPDRLVFDLDPDPSLGWDHVVDGALRVRDRLDELGLDSWVKTTGGKGLHVVVPVERRTEWDDAKAFTKAVAEDLERREPKRFVSVMSKARRKGRIFVDYLRNGRGATAVATYSARAHPGAPVSTPITWEELQSGTRSDAYGVRNVIRRLAALDADPWEGFFEARQSITSRMRRDVGAA